MASVKDKQFNVMMCAYKAMKRESDYSKLKQMKSRDIWQLYKKCLDKKGLYKIDGINTNSNKNDIIGGISCLACSDITMGFYLDVMMIAYPAMAAVIKANGDFLTHPHNRYYVYNVARSILKAFNN